MTPTLDSTQFVSARLPIEPVSSRLVDLLLPMSKDKKIKTDIVQKINLDSGKPDQDMDLMIWWQTRGIWYDCLGATPTTPAFSRTYFGWDQAEQLLADLNDNGISGQSLEFIADEPRRRLFSVVVKRSSGNCRLGLRSHYPFDDLMANRVISDAIERMNYENFYSIRRDVTEDGKVRMAVDLPGTRELNQASICFQPDSLPGQQFFVFFHDFEYQFPKILDFWATWDSDKILAAILDCFRITESELESIRLAVHPKNWQMENQQPQPEGVWDVHAMTCYKKGFDPYRPNKAIPVHSRFPVIHAIARKGDYTRLQIDVVHGPDGLFYDFQTAFGAEYLTDLLQKHSLPFELWTGNFGDRWRE
jgi:hypothetical protein